MRKTLLPLAAAAVCALAAPAAAQTERDLLRLEWVSGLYIQGTMADAAFSFDTTPFGGILVEREGGTLDVDPTFWYGLRTNYRLNNRWSVDVSWMHAQAAYRVEFPAEAQDEGNFDLEGLILGAFDFQAQAGGQLASATSDARIDTYLASARWETPMLGRWAFPYLTAGAGIYKQKSSDYVFRSDYETDPPAAFGALLAQGGDPLQIVGISRFRIDATDWLVSFGGGFRASLSDRWGADFEVEDLIQIGADFTEIDVSSTPRTDPDENRLFSTTFEGRDGLIHNLAFRLSLTYAFWPADRRR
ncbi:outer membrane beta-barrel protein [bacterium]|nr:outer membrane beta-barrel protein [bacterium]